MQNQEIIKIIENLKGRKNYEEKKVVEDKKKELEELDNHSKLKDKAKSKQQKNCSGC